MRFPFVGLLAVVSACGADDVPTFTADVEPILARSCVTSGCHGGAEPTTGLDLSPGVAYDALVGAEASQHPTKRRVDPGDAANSYLIDKVAGTATEAGGSGDAMPPPFGLAANEVELLTAWIEGGAPRE